MKFKLPLIYIKYKDHCWLDATKEKDIKKSKTTIVEEVGFLIGEDNESVKFCKTIVNPRETKGNKPELNDATAILKSDIIKFIKIKEI